ncbi:MAG: autotransporter domain-containing protein [Sphingopyxis solisilvae]|uniref:autotransporter domain-containing protein n=1 Tax=Sphingopyxis solisilvae TaxID=1886788 RepID=UPI004035156C
MCLFGLAQAVPALAQDAALYGPDDDARPTGAVEMAHNAGFVPGTGEGFIDPGDATDTPQIVINNNFTPTDVRDPTNVTGIGQIVTDAGGGSVGLCTGTLINPRTILFAAHCVNTRAATAYGAGSGGVGIAVAFETNTRANAPGETDELVRWLLGAAGGAGRFQSNQAQSLYNINQVFWNPASRAAASCTSATSCFLEADVATAVLDTPAGNVPTWALLFSPLATPTSINPATGTGYHVTIAGYGNNGVGSTGIAGSDFRRRVAENMLGALVSLNTRNTFLFGTPGSPSRPQQLYFIDFDDPARGTATANARDFNGFRDNALPREGTTGPGDSGGPLILDQTFSKPVVIGVLSGGSTFFAGQPQGSYGTQAFYQPLFLYWDWIVANNPYRYVTAVTGNRNWEDGTAWITELDPAYHVIAGGQLVNGLPTNLGGTNSGNGPQFGELCFQSPSTSPNPASNECVDIATGAVRNGVPNTATDSSSPLVIDLATGEGMAPTETAMADPGYSDTLRPAPTIANGLPGATGFVPNNVDGVRTTGEMGRYYDVTLRNTGAITLNSSVTVDRFTVAGATSQLNVASGASLNSLIEVRQLTGTVNTNGTIQTAGDYLLLSGLLTGAGTVRTPFLTSVLGSIAPGTMTTTGTLTIAGNLVLSSGSNLFIDLGPSGASDVLAVVANGGSTGNATLGGAVSFSPVSGYRITAGDRFTFLTAAGGVTGTFGSASSLSAILTPRLTYGPNSVSVEIQAGLYRNVVDPTAVQGAYAQLLDQSRGNAALAGVYGPLDLQSATTIRATLESWAPRTETLRGSLATVAADNMSRFYRDRLLQLDGGDMGGTLAMIGRPVQLAHLNMTAVGAASMQVRSDSDSVTVQQGRLPDDTSAFLAGGYLDGDSRPMASALPGGGRDRFDGFYLAGGIEKSLGDNGVLGFSLSYTDIDGTTPVGGQKASGTLYQGTLYGKTGLGGGIELSTQLSAGAFDSRTTRVADLVGTPFTLTGDDTSLIVTGEVSLAKNFDLGSIEFGPRVAARASHIGFSDIKENGGGPALRLDRSSYNSVQGRAGLALSGKRGSSFQPHLSADYVHEFKDAPASFGATFVGGPGPNAIFGLAGTDKDWFEVGGGITFKTGNVDLSIGADTTIGRKDVSNQSYRGSVTFHF